MAKKTPEIDSKYYVNAIKKMSLDIPIEAAMLPERVEKILLKNEIFTIWDIVNTDVRLLKGIGRKSFLEITECISQFLSV